MSFLLTLYKLVKFLIFKLPTLIMIVRLVWKYVYKFILIVWLIVKMIIKKRK